MQETRVTLGDAEFEELADRHRREIQLHCYRMLGSIQDADDAVQDALLRAWRSRSRLRDRDAFRSWLYRIATNVCLRTLAGRRGAARVLSEEQRPPAAFELLGPPDSDTPWLEPYPDALLDGVDDAASGPEARFETREATRLAFVAAIQHLPPRQRAVLLLRDVLGMSAVETSEILETTVGASNSALERARASIRARYPAGRPTLAPDPSEAERRLLERYVLAWESADLAGLMQLIREDASWTMPPWPQWYRGADQIAAFLSWVWRPGRVRRERLVPTRANGQPAFGYYVFDDSGPWRPFAIQVVRVVDGRVGAIANFVDDRLFAAFGLPPAPPPVERARRDSPMSSQHGPDQTG